MRRMFYYLPGVAEVTPQALVDAGLAGRFEIDPAEQKGADTQKYGKAPLDKGPDGKAGMLVSFGQGSGIGYHADSQEWHKFPQFWLGWWRDKRPRPKDLERSVMLAGSAVTLADGQQWMVPVAKLLPQRAVYDGTIWGRKLDERYRSLWELACRLRDEYWELVTEAVLLRTELGGKLGDGDDVSEKLSGEELEAWGAALETATAAAQGLDLSAVVQVLAANYRIGNEEASTLGLLTVSEAELTDECWAVVHALVDGAGILAARSKKNDPGSA